MSQQKNNVDVMGKTTRKKKKTGVNSATGRASCTRDTHSRTHAHETHEHGVTANWWRPATERNNTGHGGGTRATDWNRTLLPPPLVCRRACVVRVLGGRRCQPVGLSAPSTVLFGLPAGFVFAAFRPGSFPYNNSYYYCGYTEWTRRRNFNFSLGGGGWINFFQ